MEVGTYKHETNDRGDNMAVDFYKLLERKRKERKLDAYLDGDMFRFHKNLFRMLEEEARINCYFRIRLAASYFEDMEQQFFKEYLRDLGYEVHDGLIFDGISVERSDENEL